MASTKAQQWAYLFYSREAQSCTDSTLPSQPIKRGITISASASSFRTFPKEINLVSKQELNSLVDRISKNNQHATTSHWQLIQNWYCFRGWWLWISAGSLPSQTSSALWPFLTQRLFFWFNGSEWPISKEAEVSFCPVRVPLGLKSSRYTEGSSPPGLVPKPTEKEGAGEEVLHSKLPMWLFCLTNPVSLLAYWNLSQKSSVLDFPSIKNCHLQTTYLLSTSAGALACKLSERVLSKMLITSQCFIILFSWGLII